MKHLFCVFCMVVFLADGIQAWSAEPVISEGENLNMARCIDIAIKNQPVILQYHYMVQAGEALLGQARAGYYPQVDLTSSYNRYNAISQQNDIHSPIGLYGYDYYGNNVALKQKIYDFGKREANVDVARLNRQSLQLDVDNQITAVISNVKTAYYGALRAKRTRDVNLEAMDQYRQQLEQARLFFEAGKKPKYDVTAAELNLSSAEVQLINAENDLDNAWVTLNNAMGYDGSARCAIEDALVQAPKGFIPSEDRNFFICYTMATDSTSYADMAALFGTLPIALGLGAGGESRQPLGVAVVVGLLFSQILTLYVTPVFYVYLDKLNQRLKGR